MTSREIHCVTDTDLPEGAETGVRVTATNSARMFLKEIQSDHGAVLFHQSGGCCDGSSPMCYPTNGFKVGEGDVKLGDIDGVEFWISKSQFKAWQHTQLIIDVVAGRGGMFSLDNGREKRFLTRSRLFTEDELTQLDSM